MFFYVTNISWSFT